MEEPPNNQSSKGRAWEDTKHSFHSIKFFVGVEVMTISVCIFLATLLIPENPDKLVSAGFPAIGAIVGVLVGFGLIYLYMFIRAPYKQRNEARKQLIEIKEQLKPKLFMSVESPTPIPASKPPKGYPQSYFWRLDVTNTSKSAIKRCYGEIVGFYSIDQDGSRIIPRGNWVTPPHRIPWGRGMGNTGDNYEATLGAGQLAKIDYLVLPQLSSDYLIVPMPPDSPNERPYYSGFEIYQHDLELEIAVGSKDIEMERSGMHPVLTGGMNKL